MLDVLCVGYPSLDYMLELNDSPVVGETTLINGDYDGKPNIGGCPVNISYLLSYLEINSGLFMTVGRDFKKSGFEKFLIDGGVDLKNVFYDDTLTTSYTVLLTIPNGEQITLFYPGAMGKSFDAREINLNTKYGLLSIGEPTMNRYFLDRCIAAGIPTIFSMKGDYHSLEKSYLLDALDYSELVFMNAAEFEQLNELLEKDVLNYLKPDKTIVVTKGSKGSDVYTNERCYSVGVYPDVEVVDPTGGGDAYIAGFMASYLKGEHLIDCAISGAALSSFIIEDVGCLTNIPSKVELQKRKEFIKEIYKK